MKHMKADPRRLDALPLSGWLGIFVTAVLKTRTTRARTYNI
jgi:hypothetical protein